MCGGVAALQSEIVSTLPANFTFPVAFVDLGSSWKKQKNSYCAFADWLGFWVSGFSQQDGRKVYWTWYIANLNSRTKGDCAIRPPHCWLQRNMCVGNCELGLARRRVSWVIKKIHKQTEKYHKSTTDHLLSCFMFYLCMCNQWPPFSTPLVSGSAL